MNRSVSNNRSVLKEVYRSDKSKLEMSLAEARPHDLSRRQVTTKKHILTNSFMNAVRYTFMIACLLVFLSACISLVVYGLQYLKNREDTNFLQQFVNDDSANDGLVSISAKAKKNTETLTLSRSMAGEVIDYKKYEDSVYNEELEQMRSKLYSLMRQNSDVWGWIKVANTSIDYVIMRSGDNNFYLYRSFTKEYNRNGSIFADMRTRNHLEDNKNLVIYGHNMNTTKSMFYPLLEYATNEDAFQNRLITIITLDGIYTYSVFSVYDTSASYNYIKTSFNGDEFTEFIDACRTRSIYDKDIEVNASSSILTLSTCTVRQDNRRWAIHAVLTGISK